MSKRYSGKSFKDSSAKKQPKLNLKEKRKAKKIKLVKKLTVKLTKFLVFFKFSKSFITV